MKMYRLYEIKTNQLKKLYLNGNITEEQFNIADKFFKTHSDFEKEIDWNRGLKITWEDLEKVINKERNTKSQAKKKIRKGLEGFKEGKDYVVLEENDSYTAYQPFTWEASRMIASHYVEPSKSKYGETKDAEWCTAYQKDIRYWDYHNKIEAFIYICGEIIPSKKVAISISKRNEDASGSKFQYHLGNLNFNIWDFNDNNDTIKESKIIKVVPNLYDLIEKAYKNWNDKVKEYLLSKLKLNPQTNRYDYNGNLSIKDLEGLVSEDRDGFIINFGEIVGNFDCSRLELISLKGAPQKVSGSFICCDNKLTSLKGSPYSVRDFYCHSNYLTSLKYIPKIIRDFDCADNHLTSLEGSPIELNGQFNCSNNQLTSLKGAPQIVIGDFDCRDNYELQSLEGIGKVTGNIYKNF